MEINVILVRHGETEGNVGGIVDGIFNLPLTDVGRRQAAAAAEALKEVPLAAVYCSDLNRAADTAAEIARANLHFRGEVVKMEWLRERSFGCLEGKMWKDFSSHPKYDGWPGTWTPDGGETWPVVRDRIKKFFKTFLADVIAAQKSTSGASSPTYLVVSHGGTIQQMICWLSEEHGFERPDGHEGEFWVKIRMANTAVTRLSMVVKEDGTGFNNVKILSVYNNDHLKGKEGLKDGYAW